jgi:ATP-dependent Clp protease ATP-binding subunit ClpA
LFNNFEADITINDLAKVIELWTGIPASKVTEQEFKKLSNLKNSLKEKMSVRMKP